MSEQFADLVAVVRTDNTKLLTGLAQSNSKIASFASGITGKTALIAGGAIAAGAAIGMAINSSINAFADFDEQMTKSVSIMTGVSETMRKQMADTALDMSTRSKFSAVELAEAYYFLASAGLSAEQSIASIPVVTNFATAGAFDLAKATDLLTDAQSALGWTSKDAGENMQNMTRLGNLLVKASTLANASVEQFADAVGNKAGAAMKNFNIEAEVGLAFLAAYADQSIKSAKGGEYFSRVVSALPKVIRDNQKEFDAAGIELYKDGMLDLIGVMDDFERVLKPLSPEMRLTKLAQLGMTKEISDSILPLIGASEKMIDYRNQYRATGEIMDEVAKKQMETMNNKLKMLDNRWTKLKITIGEIYAPMKELAVDVLGPLIDAFEVLIRVNQVWTSFVVGSMRVVAAIFYDLGNEVITTFYNMGVRIDNFFKDFFKNIGGLSGAIAKFITGDFSGATEDIKRLFADINKGTRDNIKITGATFDQESKKVADNIEKLIGVFSETDKALTSKGAGTTGAKVASNVSQGLTSTGGVASKLSGALERGSVAAFSAENKAARSQANIEQNTKDTAKNSNKQVSLLDNMNKQLMAGQTIVAGSITG